MNDEQSTPSWLSYADAGEQLGLSADAVRVRARRGNWPRMRGNDGRTFVQIPDDQDELSPGRSFTQSGLVDALREAVTALREQLAAERTRSDKIDLEMAAERTRSTDLSEQLAAERTRSGKFSAQASAERTRSDDLNEQLTAERTRSGELSSLVAAERTRSDDLSEQLTAERTRSHRLGEELEAERTRSGELSGQVAAAEECAKRAEAGRQTTQDALEEQRRAEEARKVRGRWARLRAAWRGE